MKPFAGVVFSTLLVGVGCRSVTPTPAPVGLIETVPAREGRSYATAVVMRARTLEESFLEQPAWLAKNSPGARLADVETVDGQEIVFGHFTSHHDGRLFSVYALVLSDGEVREVYFDITRSLRREP